MNIVRLADVKPVPWRNGGGTTRELLAWPDASGWQLRISVAEIASDGPFSRFDGIERWFAVLEGEGVRLRIQPSFPRRRESRALEALDSRLRGNDAEMHELRRGSAPLRFDGGAAAEAELIGGPTLDFNLMAAPGAATLHWEGGRLKVMSSVVSARYDPDTATLEWEATA